jgi:succinate dehydrogenase / fumarate reductase, cytochrome b subunit
MHALLQTLMRFYASSIGKKIIVAATGAALVLFLLGHLTGNLLVFRGPEALNNYAHGLHQLGALLWVARIGLLVAVGLHIVSTIHLRIQNQAARSDGYQVDATMRASRGSTTMIWSGLTVLAFVIYHLMHFTWGTLNNYKDPNGPYGLGDGKMNVYQMIIDGFKVVPNSLFYLVAIGLLCLHLSHGVSSMFQTLGLTTKRTREPIRFLSWGLSIALFLGFASIPVSVLLGLLK